MLKKVLAYSHNPFILKTMSDWAENDRLIDFQVTDSVEKLTDLFTSEVFSVLVLDDSDLQVSLSRLVQNLSQQQPGIKILLIQPQEGESSKFSDSRYMVEQISKPFSSETFNKALHGHIGRTWLPETTENQPKAIIHKTQNDEQDIDSLRSWIKEAISPDNKPEFTNKVAAEPIAALYEMKSTDVIGPLAPLEIPPVSVSKSEVVREIKLPASTRVAEHDLKPTQIVNSPKPVRGTTPLLASITKKPLVSDAGGNKTTVFDVKNLLFHYTCVLLPRDPNFFLIQVVAERLKMILSGIHTSHNWGLTRIAIRPQQVLWSIALPAQTSPVSAIQEIRRLTSEQLIHTFQDYKNKYKEHDFWAPGYLMVSGTDCIPNTMIKSFIDLTWKEQARGT